MSRILLLDSEGNALVLHKALTKIGGFDVVAPAGEAEALAAAGQGGIGLVVANVVRDWGLSGPATQAALDFVRRLKSDPATAGLPVLIVAGGVAEAEAECLRAGCGADAVLASPYIAPLALVTKVRCLLNSSGCSQPPQPGPG